MYDISEIHESLINGQRQQMVNQIDDYVEVRAYLPGLSSFKEWTKVTRFLASGLIGVEIREIEKQ